MYSYMYAYDPCHICKLCMIDLYAYTSHMSYPVLFKFSGVLMEWREWKVEIRHPTKTFSRRWDCSDDSNNCHFETAEPFDANGSITHLRTVVDMWGSAVWTPWRRYRHNTRSPWPRNFIPSAGQGRSEAIRGGAAKLLTTTNMAGPQDRNNR